MDGRTRFKKVDKRTKFIKSYGGQETVEGYDCQRPEGTWHIEEKESIGNKILISLFKNKNPRCLLKHMYTPNITFIVIRYIN